MAYTLDQAGDPTEKDRLAILQRYYDPRTIRALDQLPVAPGWRCVDAGAGAGSISRWLAQRVGSNGSVLAVDLDLTLLQALASPVLTVRCLDIRSEELPGDAHLVHARLLLEHLPDPHDVLERMVRALRPGGWLVLTDTDFTTVRFSESGEGFDRVTDAFVTAARAAGFDPRLGPELPSMFENAGLVDVTADVWQTYERPGDSTRLLAMTYRRFRDRLIGEGAAADDIARIERGLISGELGLYGPTSWMVLGRRPPSEPHRR